MRKGKEMGKSSFFSVLMHLSWDVGLKKTEVNYFIVGSLSDSRVVLG